MYYELYIDVFFLINLMMDYILLQLVTRIVKCPATHGNICIGAVLGAVLTCIVIVIFGGNVFVEFILFHGVINTVMIQAGLRTGWNRTFLKAWIVLYISAFLVGGVMGVLHQYIRSGSLFFALALVGYYTSLSVWNLLRYMAGRAERQRNVRLIQDGKECVVKAVIDTGNCLRDSLTGKPVSIISRKVAFRIFSEGVESVRYIPYHSVGRSQGAMPMTVLDRMCILAAGKGVDIWIEKPLVAICEEDITADDYEMLMHPELL